MSAIFDPDAGILRLSHGALSVLARLAADPNHPDLLDHAVAPPLAALRGAGVLGAGGIHPDVLPLAAVIGAPLARVELELAEPGFAWQARGWVAPALIVVAVPVKEAVDAFDLVADAVESGADLISELVTLPAVADTDGTDPIRVHADVLDQLGTEPAADVPAEAVRLLDQVNARWRLTIHSGTDRVDALEILDAGEAGLWLQSPGDANGLVELAPVTAVEVRRRIAGLLRSAVG
jgi:hypothetical protein